MLIFVLKNDRQSRQVRHEGGPIEFGRGPERELPRVIVEDRYTSRDQMRVEELPSGDVRIVNLGAPITVSDGTQIATGESRQLIAPTQLNFGYSTLQIGVIPKESDDPFSKSLQTVSRPAKIDSKALLQSQFKSGVNTPNSETLAQWFGRLLQVQRAAAGSDEFYLETARAVVDLIGLERGMVLLRTGQDWQVVAKQSVTEHNSGKFSRRVLEEVVRKQSTFYQTYKDVNHEGSLQMVDAVVAAPIIDQHNNVVGAVYGSRDMASASFAESRGITALEAQLVDVLAGAVSAGLTRCAREAEVTRARVQFEQFVSPELAKALERDAGILGASERELTMLFTDLRGFSRIAERIGPEETYHLLSDILDRLTNQIMDHGGVVIDYYGDGLAAMWNAPFDQPDHAQRAAAAAQAMQNELPAINVSWAERLGGVIRIGIGINTGVSQVGNSGSKRRMKYGPRGHAVNLTSRVEAATKVLGVPCLITESTKQLLPATTPVRRIACARLTGMASAINLYELPPDHPPDSWFVQRDLYERALTLYEQDQPSECLEAIDQLVEKFGTHDVPTVRLQLRAQTRLGQPSPEFDSVYSVETK